MPVGACGHATTVANIGRYALGGRTGPAAAYAVTPFRGDENFFIGVQVWRKLSPTGIVAVTPSLQEAAHGQTTAFTAVAAVALVAPAAAASAGPAPVQHDEQIQYQRWSSYADWHGGTGKGIVNLPGVRTGVTMLIPAGRTDFTDPHTGITKAWDYSTWTSPVHQLGFGATEVVASWNADVPAGTSIQVELHGTYFNGEQTPWYVMGRWAKGDADIKRSTLDGQGDPYSTIWTDTFSIDDASRGVLLRTTSCG